MECSRCGRPISPFTRVNVFGQSYCGPCELDRIAELKQAMPIPPLPGPVLDHLRKPDPSLLTFEELTDEICRRCTSGLFVVTRPARTGKEHDTIASFHHGSITQAVGLLEYAKIVFYQKLAECANGPDVHFGDSAERTKPNPGDTGDPGDQAP